MFDELMKRIDRLRLDIAGKPELRWGVVTAVSPLAVRLDGDTDPLAGSPSTLVGSSRVGDRVQLAIQNRRATIIGAASSGDTGWYNLPYAEGFIPGTAGQAQVCVKNGVAYFRGGAQVTTGDFTTAERIIVPAGGIPVAARPSQYIRSGGQATLGKSAAIMIHPNGGVYVRGNPNGTPPTWISGAVSWPLG